MRLPSTILMALIALLLTACSSAPALQPTPAPTEVPAQTTNFNVKGGTVLYDEPYNPHGVNQVSAEGGNYAATAKFIDADGNEWIQVRIPVTDGRLWIQKADYLGDTSALQTLTEDEIMSSLGVIQSTTTEPLDIAAPTSTPAEITTTSINNGTELRLGPGTFYPIKGAIDTNHTLVIKSLYIRPEGGPEGGEKWYRVFNRNTNLEGFVRQSDVQPISQNEAITLEWEDWVRIEAAPTEAPTQQQPTSAPAAIQPTSAPAAVVQPNPVPPTPVPAPRQDLRGVALRWTAGWSSNGVNGEPTGQCLSTINVYTSVPSGGNRAGLIIRYYDASWQLLREESPNSGGYSSKGNLCGGVHRVILGFYGQGNKWTTVAQSDDAQLNGTQGSADLVFTGKAR